MRNAHRYQVKAVFSDGSVNPDDANTGLDKYGNPIKKAVISSVTENEVTITISNPDHEEEFHLSIVISGFMEGMETREMSTYNDLPKIQALYIDADLESLSFDVGTLNRSFSADMYDYTLSVPYATDKIEVSASVPSDAHSSYTINGSEAKQSGETSITEKDGDTITITVTADCGRTQVYTVKVNWDSNLSGAGFTITGEQIMGEEEWPWNQSGALSISLSASAPLTFTLASGWTSGGSITYSLIEWSVPNKDGGPLSGTANSFTLDPADFSELDVGHQSLTVRVVIDGILYGKTIWIEVMP